MKYERHSVLGNAKLRDFAPILGILKVAIEETELEWDCQTIQNLLKEVRVRAVDLLKNEDI